MKTRSRLIKYTLKVKGAVSNLETAPFTLYSASLFTVAASNRGN